MSHQNRTAIILTFVSTITLVVMGVVVLKLYSDVHTELKVVTLVRSNIAELERNGSKLEETLLETREVLKKVVGGNLDCKDLLEAGNTEDGVYTILIGWSPVRVLCDMVGGGWTVFQHRFDGSVNFRRNFENYTRGFGDPNNEFWMGLENIHQMTSNGQWMLQIDLEAFDGETRNAQYKDFKVHSGSRYELAFGAYNGTAGDSLSSSNGEAFSTYDMDQDGWDRQNCASDGVRNGAWWWWGTQCGYSNLNSNSYNDNRYRKGMFWYYFKGYSTPMKMTMMKMIKV